MARQLEPDHRGAGVVPVERALVAGSWVRHVVEPVRRLREGAVLRDRCVDEQ